MGEDPVGLQVGSKEAEVQELAVALEATPEVVNEAQRQEIDLLVTHHPLIFEPLNSIEFSDTTGSIIKNCIEKGLHLLTAHTNLDIAPGGLNDLLAEKLGLADGQVLQPTYWDKLLKLVVFVPQDHLEEVREAVSRAGAGCLGNYSHATFLSEGTGTFLPQEGSQPFWGRKGQLQKVKEFRLETILPATWQEKVIAALRESHPYEEPAYDIYPMEIKGRSYGLGRWGGLPETLSLEQVAQKVKTVTSQERVKVWGHLSQQINSLAVCSGSGSSLIKTAAEKGVDVYISGDLKYHEIQDGLSKGISLIDAGHLGTEELMVNYLGDYLRRTLEKQGASCGVETIFLPSFRRESFI